MASQLTESVGERSLARTGYTSFFFATSGALLAIALIGFTPSLYLRWIFIPDQPMPVARWHTHMDLWWRRGSCCSSFKRAWSGEVTSSDTANWGSSLRSSVLGLSSPAWPRRGAISPLPLVARSTSVLDSTFDWFVPFCRFRTPLALSNTSACVVNRYPRFGIVSMRTPSSPARDGVLLRSCGRRWVTLQIAANDRGAAPPTCQLHPTGSRDGRVPPSRLAWAWRLIRCAKSRRRRHLLTDRQVWISFLQSMGARMDHRYWLTILSWVRVNSDHVFERFIHHRTHSPNWKIRSLHVRGTIHTQTRNFLLHACSDLLTVVAGLRPGDIVSEPDPCRPTESVARDLVTSWYGWW